MRQMVVTGAMCSGKTTLVGAYASDSRVVCIEDQARKYLQEHPRVDRKSLAASRAIIAAYRKATAQVQKTGNPAASLSDGSVLNPVAHLQAWGDGPGATLLLKECLADLRQIAMFFLMDIDDVPYVLDEVRTESIAVRRQLQRAYETLLQELHLPHQRVSGAPAIRKQRLDAYLQDLVVTYN
jgi:nicotinamide riboside kinase